MFLTLLIGSAVLLVSMMIQVAAVVVMLRWLIRRRSAGHLRTGFLAVSRILTAILLTLFAGHLVQIGIWAWLFLYLGEFDRFADSFYYSTVNFSSLGYGDIVMSSKWRLLGALEAANGVLMFGLSASTMFLAMSQLFQQRIESNRHVGQGDDV